MWLREILSAIAEHPFAFIGLAIAVNIFMGILVSITPVKYCRKPPNSNYPDPPS